MGIMVKPSAKVTEAEIERMKKLRAQGLTYAEIGRVLQRDRTTVRRYCLSVRAPENRGAERKYDERVRQLALDLLEKGWSKKRVAKVVGCSPSTIQAWLEGYTSKDYLKVLSDPEVEELIRDPRKAILACYRYGWVLGGE